MALWIEALTFDKDYFILRICRSWVRKRSNDIEVSEWKTICFLGIVHTIERERHMALITAQKAVWWGAPHHGLVDIVSWDCSAFHFSSWGSRIVEAELAPDVFSICDVWKVVSCDIYFCAASERTSSGEVLINIWLVEVAKLKAGVMPVKTIKTNLDGQGCSDVVGWRCITHNPDCRAEWGANNHRTNLAVWEQSVFSFLVEPDSWDLNRCTTWGQAREWLNFLDWRRFVIIELNKRIAVGVLIDLQRVITRLGVVRCVKHALSDWNVHWAT